MLNKTYKANPTKSSGVVYLQASLNITDTIPSNANTSFRLMLYFNRENNFNYLDLENPDDYRQFYIIEPNVVIGDVSLYTSPSINKVNTEQNISITSIVAGLTNAPSQNIPIPNGPIPMEFWSGFTGDTPGLLTNTTSQIDLDFKSQVVEIGRKPYGFPDRDWNSIDSNDIGDVLVASAYDDQIYVSTNNGTSWAPVESKRLWTAVATNALGDVIAATTNGGKIYTSVDYGNTWNDRETARTWSDIDLNDTGNAIVACVNSGFIYRSTNFGVSWTAVLSDAPRAWKSIVCNQSGTSIIACVNNGYIYYSNDSGTTWNFSMFDTFRAWADVAYARNTNVAFAVVNNGFIYKSTDNGATWTPILNDVPRNWSSITSDDLGVNIYACLLDSNAIFYSDDGGLNWTQYTFNQDNANWSSIATNTLGNIVASTIFGGQIEYSSDYGENWFVTINTYKYLGLYIEGLTPATEQRNDAVVHILIKVYTG
jgi:photosystem II stability/assembly factor-like uncharacterized protein